MLAALSASGRDTFLATSIGHATGTSLFVPNERPSSADESRPRQDPRCKIGIGSPCELLYFAAVRWPAPGVQVAAAVFTYRDSS
jgi:hypothetical protein